MKTLKNIYRKKLLFLACAVFFFLALSIPVMAQVRLEANLGLNLFDVVGTELGVEWDISEWGWPGDPLLKGDLEATVPTSALFGVYVGYNVTPNVAVGGEFAFFKATAEGKETIIESDDWWDVIPAGDADIQILRIGPAFRYYFMTGKVQPFIHACVAYTSMTIDIEDLEEKLKEGLLDIGFGVGALYFVAPQIYIGGYARGDYYLNIKKSEVEDAAGIPGAGDVISSRTKWLPVSIIFCVGGQL